MFIRNEKFKEYLAKYPVVSGLIALNIIVHILASFRFGEFSLFQWGVGANYLIGDGEWWRLITPMFLHAGFLHLLFNMFSLYLFGPELERLTGKVRFLTIYFLAGLFGTILTYLLQDANYVHVGASGAIFGIFGAFGALVYYTRKAFPGLRQIILPIIVISVIMTFLQPNVNATAHITGLVVGFLIGLSFFHPKRIVSWKKKSPIRRVK
ncbi:rhomboid family intramembrane serine protease [Paenisporosarcina cavernae]|uniref:Rhomboid family intramembrane serine protease n=1 Tax=Paenisporosarcina cavernae TaxID=2320858 RepID=A0A385YXP3_9BACL|nr:rhomboid family intramembrane serine protease [Paenisporosarcina cavernae]AYC30368.1 rhomboid family intramembrane serine protease [Paenisporosarcina cavernae]